ncbi:molybdopterin cofactor-binding domain-containing protein [Zoogloea sp.]|uniref:xanthine dehydrogenase family protein molybdopterin-binding subunit n=1 Tax=Zoogloea sp. TaxID=49181 RepID=UPI0035B208F1
MHDAHTPNAPLQNLSRRRFLQGSAGLTLGFCLPVGARAAGAAKTPAAAPAFEANAFLRIGTDNSVTVISKHLEMGQGTYTGLATILAEELDADWNSVRVEGAPADAKRYNNLNWGPFQGTGGSSAMANSWMQLRQAGAAGRAMLVAAAAKRWGVAPSSLWVDAGVVSHPESGRSARFGELAEAAAQEAVPAALKLKEPADFRLVGKRAPRRDSAAKTDGSAQFTQDVHLPGMRVALVAHPSRFGATVKSFDARAALAVKGVLQVVHIPTGVAVLAKDTWSAKKGRDALKVVWDESAAFKEGSDALWRRYAELATRPGTVARSEGQAAQALKDARRVQLAAYRFPYLAHAPMEPLNCVIQLGPEGCDVWNGEQMQTADQFALAQLLGLKPEQVRLHMLYAGGSFGRRASKDSDYLREAAQIAKAAGGTAPVKLVWLREDDMQAGYYRPMFYHTLEAAIDAQGRLSGWQHRLVGQSVMAGSPFAGMVKDGVDPTSVEGAANLPYAIPNLQVELHTPADVGVPVLWWRSVGSSHTAFSTECFLDEVAQAMGRDPVELRLELLAKHPRHAAVLRLAAEKAGWGQPLAARAGVRRGRGIAVHESFASYVAQVAEVSVGKDGSIRVDKVICAVDCGIAINPDVIRAQVEGGVAFALSAALYGDITLKEGAVEQANFDSYMPLRINEMPVVEVHILPSAAAPTGIGEPGVPPLAPAVANAIAAATGTRLRSLPFDPNALKA